MQVSGERDSSVPDRLEDANVAFTTRMTETTVMYHLLAVDQFLELSTSLGPNSRRPSSLRWTSSEASMSHVLHGFAIGRDKNRSSFSIVEGVVKDRGGEYKRDQKVSAASFSVHTQKTICVRNAASGTLARTHDVIWMMEGGYDVSRNVCT